MLLCMSDGLQAVSFCTLSSVAAFNVVHALLSSSLLLAPCEVCGCSAKEETDEFCLV